MGIDMEKIIDNRLSSTTVEYGLIISQMAILIVIASAFIRIG